MTPRGVGLRPRYSDCYEKCKRGLGLLSTWDAQEHVVHVRSR